MENEKPKRSVGRPKKKYVPPFELDLSMTPEIAKEQEVIAKSKERIFKAKKEELRVAELERKLVSTKEVTKLVQTIFTKLKGNLYSATNKLPARIVGKSHEEVSDITFKFIDEVLAQSINDFDKMIAQVKIDEDDLYDVEGEDNDN